MKPHYPAKLVWLAVIYSTLQVASAQSADAPHAQSDSKAASAPEYVHPATALSALQDAQKKSADAFVVQD